MLRRYFLPLFLLPCIKGYAQADNEIQVYASPTIGKNRMITELHSNYTIKGAKRIDGPQANWLNETLEITYGLAGNIELGFYTFSTLSADGKYQYLGNQIRPRVTVPQSWQWPVGVSLSAEFGFFRDNSTVPFYWQGEIRPIVDKTIGNWYLAVNPNIDFVVSGANKGYNFAPQAKIQYAIKNAWGVGIEYYSGLGEFRNFLTGSAQEHLIGPMMDYLADPRWELNTGILYGLSPSSNQLTFKLLLGRRFGK